MPILHISDTIALIARKHRIFTEWCVVESLHYLDNRKTITLKLGKNLFSQLSMSVLADSMNLGFRETPKTPDHWNSNCAKRRQGYFQSNVF
jgi:hypothetical protein